MVTDRSKDGHSSTFMSAGLGRAHMPINIAEQTDRCMCPVKLHMVVRGTSHGHIHHTPSHSPVVGVCVSLSTSSSRAGRWQDGGSLVVGGQIWGTAGPALTWMGAARHRTHQV